MFARPSTLVAGDRIIDIGTGTGSWPGLAHSAFLSFFSQLYWDEWSSLLFNLVAIFGEGGALKRFINSPTENSVPLDL